MATLIHDGQLSLEDVLGAPGAVVKSEFALSGKGVSFVTSLKRDENVTVTVTDADGQIVFRTNGWVKGVNIVRDQIGGKWGTTLKHQIKLGEEAPELDTADTE